LVVAVAIHPMPTIPGTGVDTAGAADAAAGAAGAATASTSHHLA